MPAVTPVNRCCLYVCPVYNIYYPKDKLECPDQVLNCKDIFMCSDIDIYDCMK